MQQHGLACCMSGLGLLLLLPAAAAAAASPAAAAAAFAGNRMATVLFQELLSTSIVPYIGTSALSMQRILRMCS